MVVCPEGGETPDQEYEERQNNVSGPPVELAENVEANEIQEDIDLDIDTQNSVPIMSSSKVGSLPCADGISVMKKTDTEIEQELPLEAGGRELEDSSWTAQIAENEELSPSDSAGEQEAVHSKENIEPVGDGEETCEEGPGMTRSVDVIEEEVRTETVAGEPTDLEGATGTEQTVLRQEGQAKNAEACSPRTKCMLKRKAMKRRPCSLPVSELETVIASSCKEPETPRSHYIRIHHLLHSLPSAQQRSTTQDDEGTTDPQPYEDVSPRPAESKSEEVEDSEEAASEARSPSVVPECLRPCCRRTLPRSLSIERLSELNQLLEGHSHTRFESEDGEPESGPGGQRRPRESECEFCDTSCYSTSCYSTSCYSTSCYSNSGHEGHNHFCSHTRLSSVDSTRLSESTVFSSQEEEEENSAFETDPGPSPEARDQGDGTAQWMEEQIEGNQDSPLAGPSVDSPGR